LTQWPFVESIRESGFDFRNSTCLFVGSDLHVRFQNGYYTNSDVIQFRESSSSLATNCALLNSAIVDYNPPDDAANNKWVSLFGMSNRVENCYLKGKTNLGTTLVVWLLAAVVALGIGLASVWRKAARLGAPLAGPVGRRFAMSLAAPLVAGGALTWGLWRNGGWAMMPAVWLLLYGAGALAGGVFSVATVRLLGATFMALGVAALVTPPSWGNVWLGLGFGVLHMVCGLYVAKKYEG
jgi:hypothetical protein